MGAGVAATHHDRYPLACEFVARRQAPAKAAAPAASTRFLVTVSSVACAARIWSSLTSTKSSRWRRRICCGKLEGGARGESLGVGLHSVLDGPALLPRSIGGRRGGRLHPDYADRRVDGLGDDARPGGPAPPADRDEDHLGRRLVLDDLERPGGDARDQVRFVPRMDITEPLLPGERLAQLPARRSRGRARGSRRRGSRYRPPSPGWRLRARKSPPARRRV